jgi:hypothetical protein
MVTQKDMIGIVLAVALAAVFVRLLAYNPVFGVSVNDAAKELFGA